MTKRTVGYLAFGVMLCGVGGLWVMFSGLSNLVIGRLIGTMGFIALVLAATALGRRSWTRLPLLAACAVAAVLISSGFFDSRDPSANAGPAYLFYNSLLIMAAAVTLGIVKLGHSRQE